MKLIQKLLWTFVCLLLAANAAYAQGVGASGSITGTVTDPAGAVVPKVSLAAVDVAKGARYATSADSSGHYLFTSLPPGTYNVTAQMTGFQTEVQKGVVVIVGETATVDFHLKVATTGQAIEVTAEAPVVDTERGSQADTMTDQYIESLPIDRRDYLTFTLLMPGVSNSTRLADDQDFRVKQTPQSGLSFYGSNGRGNSITVDGGEAQDDAGGVRLTVSQDAVQEFQVNRSNYGADLGGASGASINIATKSGENTVHGSLFSFFRNDGMDARDPFAFTQALAPGEAYDPAAPASVGVPTKNSLQRYQYGGSLGGPIKKDKTFFFVTFEGLYQNAQNAVPLLTNTDIFLPTPAQDAVIAQLAAEPATTMVTCFPATMLPAPTCAGALESALTVSPVTGLTPLNTAINEYLIGQFESNGGLFHYNSREYLFSARLDHHIDSTNQLSFIFHFGHDLEENPDVQSLTGYSAGSSIHTYDDTLQGAWFHQFSPQTQNELRAQFNYEHFDVIPNEPGEVGIQILGYANNLGTNIFLPNFSILRRTEIADNFTMTRGHHTFSFGGSELLRGNHSESHTFFPGRFVFGPLPGADLSPLLAATSLDSIQAASLSAPQVYQQGFGNPDYPAYTRPLTGLYWQDAWAVTSNFKLTYGIRYEIDSQFEPLNTYYGDVAPRISFAWDPLKDHKTVIRGGYGIFYGPVDTQIPQVDLSLGVLNKNRSTVENHNNTAQVPDQVNNAVNTCGVGVTAFGPAGVIVPGTGTSPCNRYISIYVDPGFSLLPFLENAGQVFGTLFSAGLIQCTTPTAGNEACITPQSLLPVAAGGVFPNPTGSGIFVQSSGQLSPLTVLFSNPPNYRPSYTQQASLGIEREIARGFSISISGIYSHTLHLPVAIDTNLLPTTPTSTIPLANGKTYTYKNWNLAPATDPLQGSEGLPCAANPYICFVNPLIIQNNQYTSAASSLYYGALLEVKKQFSNYFTLIGNYTYSHAYDTSTDFNTDYGQQDPTNLGLDRGPSEFDQRNKLVIAGVFDSPWKQAVLSGFELSPIFNYHSGLPFNLLAGGAVNGDNHITNERPFGAPRDSGIGPNYIDFDMRLSWQHKLGEKVNLKLTAEGFNLANRTNYASVNNEVGPFFGLLLPGTTLCPTNGLCPDGNTSFKVHGFRPGTPLPGGGVATPSTPLAFTSDFPKREVQLGLRFTF